MHGGDGSAMKLSQRINETIANLRRKLSEPMSDSSYTNTYSGGNNLSRPHFGGFHQAQYLKRASKRRIY